MNIKVSIGEIVDKLSILHIKTKRITDVDKLVNIEKEYLYLREIVFANLNINIVDYNELFVINEQLWDIEDHIRIKEKNKEFDDKFIELARLVYITNDIRFRVKNLINLKYGSEFKEEKSYEQY
jgi:hypothetical protein